MKISNEIKVVINVQLNTNIFFDDQMGEVNRILLQLYNSIPHDLILDNNKLKLRLSLLRI
jgi:hypothetical protein